MAIKDSGVAARAKEVQAKSADELLREARQAQKFREIAKDDNASTTGRLVNPPAAVIPNPTGAGAEAGATGFFGSQLHTSADTNYRGGRGDGTPSPSFFDAVIRPLFTDAPGAMASDGQGGRRIKTGNVNPMLVPTVGYQFRGATVGGGANAVTPNLNTSRTNVYGRPQPQPSEFVNPFSSNYIAQTYASPTIRAGGTLSPDKQGSPFAGATASGGMNAQYQREVIPSTRTNPLEAYLNSRTYTGGVLTGDKPVPDMQNTIGGDKQSRLSAPTNVPSGWGTAGLYTYGQFSNKEDAFVALMDKIASYESTTGTSAGLTIPATIAQNLGLSEVLQQPGSGWVLVNGAWKNTGAAGGTDYSNVGTTDFTSTNFYKNYAANNVAFEDQLRYDPATGRYISVGAWMQKKNDKQGYVTRGNREAKLRQKRKDASKMSWSEIQDSYDGGYSYYQPVEQTPSPFIGSWGVVNFNTGTG